MGGVVCNAHFPATFREKYPENPIVCMDIIPPSPYITHPKQWPVFRLLRGSILVVGQSSLLFKSAGQDSQRHSPAGRCLAFFAGCFDFTGNGYCRAVIADASSGSKE